MYFDSLALHSAKLFANDAFGPRVFFFSANLATLGGNYLPPGPMRDLGCC